MKKEWAKPEYAEAEAGRDRLWRRPVPTRATARPQGLLQSLPEPQGHHRADHGRHRRRRQGGRRQGPVGKVFVTGLGLPSEMKGARAERRDRHVSRSGTRSTWATRATMIAATIVKGKATGAGGRDRSTLAAWAKITIDADGEAAMAEPFTFDKRTSSSSRRSSEVTADPIRVSNGVGEAVPNRRCGGLACPVPRCGEARRLVTDRAPRGSLVCTVL